MITKIKTFICLFFILANSSKAYEIIRDPEIEDAIQLISDKILKAANLDRSQVNFYIVNDNNINAFVAHGSNVFINTGLIKISSAQMLAGVIAHEMGHITAGHLIKKNKNIQDSMIKTLAGFGVGLIAATLAGGGNDAANLGMAVGLFSQHSSERQFLKYNREQESIADQLAIKYLKRSNISVDGLIDLLNVLMNNELSLDLTKDQYRITHPLSITRINNLIHLKNTNQYQTILPGELIKKYDRSKLKLLAFTQDPHKTLNFEYLTLKDKLFAHSIALFRKNNFNAAISTLNDLVKLEPKNYYLYDLRGQFFFESGQIERSISDYEKANKNINSDLIAIALAKSYLNSKSSKNLNNSILVLKRINKEKLPYAYYLLGQAYGKKNKLGISYLNFAKYSLSKLNKKDALHYASLSRKYLKENSFEYLQLKDLINSANNIDKK